MNHPKGIDSLGFRVFDGSLVVNDAMIDSAAREQDSSRIGEDYGSDTPIFPL
jgi:hypothetical protein